MSAGSAQHRSAVPTALREAFGLDPRSLGLFRIGLGLLLLANLAGRAPVFAALYGGQGVLPRHMVDRTNPGWVDLYLPYLVDGSLPVVFGVAGLSALLAGLLTVGLGTRWVAPASWFLLVSLNTRNPLATSYEDSVLTLLLFFGSFLPLGARFSLDARRSETPGSDAPVVSGASAALVVQFACVYLFGALLKTGDAWRAGGDAVFYAVSQNYAVRPVAALAAPHREVLGWLTGLTWAWELCVALLLMPLRWSGPLRTLGVLSVWTFHAGLGVFMTLWLFPWVMAVGGVALLPGWAWERLGAGSGRAAPGEITPDGLPGWLRHGVPLAALAYVLAVNVVGLSQDWELPGPVQAVGGTLRLDQRWAMYAPEPEPWDYYYVVPGTLADGSRVDLERGGQPLSFDAPSLPWRGPSRAWGLYLDHARVHRHKGPGLALAAYLCRTWNETHAGPRRLVRVEWLQERFDLRRDRAHEQRWLGAWSCAAGPGGVTRPAPRRR